METLVRILIVGNDESIIDKLGEALIHPQITIDRSYFVPKDKSYHFYVLGKSTEVDKSVDAIREHNTRSPIYLYGSACDKSLPLRQLTKCNIAACLESEENMKNFVDEVQLLRKRIVKIHEASSKLDSLRAGDFKTLARQMKKTDPEKFRDYLQNHPLPMLLVNEDLKVLYANECMEQIIGISLSGISISTFWNEQALREVLAELKKEGQLLGKEVTLKSVTGKSLRMKLYTSLHYDEAGNWINSRCLFVPIKSSEFDLPNIHCETIAV